MAKHRGKCPKCGARVELDTGLDERVACPRCQASLSLPGKSKLSDRVDPLVGERLGEFEIVEILGRGGMGAVYKARQASLGRFVAIKILPRALSRDASFIERFTREAQAAAAVSHPNIIEIHAVGQARGFQFIAMELVDGETLADVLRREGRLPADRAVAVMRQVIAALAKAHAAGILHRDIKPSNILLTREGLAKVADFGLAKRPGTDISVTASGALLGTPLYMPPEIGRGQPLDVRSDLYSLGATFYHVLAGRPPFEGASGAQLAVQHVEAPVPSLHDAAPDVPPALCRVIHRLLRKKPADRHQSADELRDALERVGAHLAAPDAEGTRTLPGAARRSRAEHLAARKQRQRRTALIAAISAVAAIAVLAGVVLATRSRGPAKVAPDPRELAAGALFAKAERARQDDRPETCLDHVSALDKSYAATRFVGAHRDQIDGLHKWASAGVRQQRADWQAEQLLKRAQSYARSGERARALRCLDDLEAKHGKTRFCADNKGQIDKLRAELEKPPAPPAWELALKRADKEAKALLAEKRFGDAIAAYGAVVNRFQELELRQRVDAATTRIRQQGDAACAECQHGATELKEEKKFAEARAALDPVVKTYGLPDKAEQARKLLAEIAAAEKEHKATVASSEAEAAQRAAAEKRRRAEERYAKALAPIEATIAAWDFRAAAQALAKLSFKEDSLAKRLATRRDEVERLATLKAKMIARINTSKPPLRKSTLLIPGINGDLAKADETGITARLSAKKSELHRWPDLGERSIARLASLAIDAGSADDCLAAGILSLALGDPAAAGKHFERGRELGAAIGRYLGPLAAAALARAQELIQKKELKEARAALADIEKQYGKTPWFASHTEELAAARRTITESEAEGVYAEAMEHYKKKELFDLKAALERLKRDYPNAPPMTDPARTPSVAEMAEAVKDIGDFITVRKDGKGDHKSIQAAIDAAPPKSLIEIEDNALYREKLVIPEEKQSLILRGARGRWPVITSAGRGPDIDVLLAVHARGTTVERLILAHARPAGGTPCCLSAVWKGRRRKDTLLFRLRASFVFMHGTAGLKIEGLEAVVEDSMIVGNWGNHASRVTARNCLVSGNFGTAYTHAGLRLCTISGVLGFQFNPVAVVDSIVAKVGGGGPKSHQLQYCDLVAGKPKSGGPKLGTGCFSADPQFVNPRDLDYRLRKTSPCRGRASDRGDMGCRFTPEMLEMVKLAHELRKKGIIKF